jgi:aminomethyltransferase
MVPFGGWDMPVQYRGILEEHRAVRSAAGLFDVSHMGEVEFRGAGALAALQRLTCNDAARLQVGQVQYTALTTPRGTFVDDLTVARLGDDRYLVTMNAGNVRKDLDWMRANVPAGTTLLDRSAETALIAIQGPRSAEILQPMTDLRLDGLRYYWCAEGRVLGRAALVSRTGYTGEDGFEVYLAPADVGHVWEVLLERGGATGLVPCGLGARDTLRLEAKMALYGNDIDEEHSVLEADLGWIVKLEKGEFIGREALAAERAAGSRRKLVGFEMTGRGIARSHYPIRRGGEAIGVVTSGGPSPTLGSNIGLGYVAAEHAAVGTEVAILIREQPVPARIVKTPFYKRPR